MILVKKDNRGTVYETAEGHKIFYRQKGSVSGDNDTNNHEVIYFISGKAKITYRDISSTINAPTRIVFEENTYHKIEAITDISFVLLSS